MYCNKTDDGWIFCTYDLFFTSNPYLKDVYTLTETDRHDLNIDINSFKILSLTDISEKIDISEAENLMEWHIVKIEDNMMKISFTNKDYIKIFPTYDIKDINTDYFNPDYAQQSDQQSY